ncbi:hypothetical protein Tco_0775950 [Tanacetum coccineum]
MPRVVKSRDEIFSRWGYCDNHDLSRLEIKPIERDRLIGIGFVLNFMKFILFTFGDKEMISVIEAVSRKLSKHQAQQERWWNEGQRLASILRETNKKGDVSPNSQTTTTTLQDHSEQPMMLETRQSQSSDDDVRVKIRRGITLIRFAKW